MTDGAHPTTRTDDGVTGRRWVVTGAGGMLGHDLLDVLHAHGADVVALTRADVDVTDPAAVDAVVGTALAAGGPGAVLVNCAAWTAVDAAQTAEPQAFAVNAVAPQLLARVCARTGAAMTHLSTDYVFDGSASEPYAETAPLAPRSAYGRTKAAGEWAVRAELPDAHRIVRTAWLYGAHGGSFVATMARLAGAGVDPKVVDDQVGQPTWTADLARRIVELVAADAPAGTYHGTSSGQASWFELARAVFAGYGHDPLRVSPTTSERYARDAAEKARAAGAPAPATAPRPAWSVLAHDACAAAGLDPMPDWQDALKRFLDGAGTAARSAAARSPATGSPATGSPATGFPATRSPIAESTTAESTTAESPTAESPTEKA